MPARFLSAALVVAAAAGAPSAAVEFRENGPFDTEFGWQRALPVEFGRGEFTLEIRFRATPGFPVGPTRPQGAPAQRKNWAEADHEPYSAEDWWYEGNFLVDGHNNDHPSMGTFGLQFYGGGRLRWLIGDGTQEILGGLRNVGAYPAAQSSPLIGGEWHWVAAVRRFSGDAGADLELWIDGERIATEHTQLRTDMREFWDDWNGYVHDVPGWFWGGERQVASRLLDQYEDFKGEISDVRFWSIARAPDSLTQPDAPVAIPVDGLVGLYAFPAEFGGEVCNAVTGAECIEFIAIDDTWRLGGAKLTAADWLLACLALAAAAAAVLRARADRQVGNPKAARVWFITSTVFAMAAVFTLLDLYTLAGQIARASAHSQGWYAWRKPLQILAVLVTAAALGFGLRRMLSSLRSTARAARFAAIVATLLIGLLLVRSASWHVTDQILEFGPGALTFERVAECAASISILAVALMRRPTMRSSE